MKFLDIDECEERLTPTGLDGRAMRRGVLANRMKHAAVFAYKSRMENAGAVSARLVAELGEFKSALLWAYAFPWGDRSLEEDAPEDWRHYYAWRRSQGETRGLNAAPGHLFETGEQTKLTQVIEFSIYTGWDAVLTAWPLRRAMMLSHDDLIIVQARHSLTKIADDLQRLGLGKSEIRSA